MPPTLLRLNIGCGPTRLEGEIGVDKYPTSARDVSADLFYLPYSDASCEFVRYDHILEHIEYRSVVRALREAYRVLCVSGVIHIGVPDLEATCRAFIETQDMCEKVGYLRNIYGSQTHEGEYHKGGFSSDTLNDLLTTVGFKSIEIAFDPTRPEGICLVAEAVK